jgi:hypothetical protein
LYFIIELIGSIQRMYLHLEPAFLEFWLSMLLLPAYLDRIGPMSPIAFTESPFFLPIFLSSLCDYSCLSFWLV